MKMNLKMNSSCAVLDSLISEKRSLKGRLVELNLFFQTDDFKSLSCLQQKLMFSQFTAMQTYLGILDLRISDLRGVYKK